MNVSNSPNTYAMLSVNSKWETLPQVDGKRHIKALPATMKDRKDTNKEDEERNSASGFALAR